MDTTEHSPDIDTAAGRPASQSADDCSGPEGTTSLAQRIEDANAMVAYQDLGGGLLLAFKVRPVGVAEAAQAGILVESLNALIGVARKPNEEDMTGLEAAEAAAAQATPEEQAEVSARRMRAAVDVARRCVIAVEDFDAPGTWRRVVWVGDPEQQGDDEDGSTRLHLESVLTGAGLERIALAALKPAHEVAGAWRRFRR
jgi:hypothetical protein